MKPNRRLVLRREVMTSLDVDELRGLAAGQPVTINLQCVFQLSDCIVIQDSILCPPTNGLVGCPTTLDPPRCAGM